MVRLFAPAGWFRGCNLGRKALYHVHGVDLLRNQRKFRRGTDVTVMGTAE